MSKQRTPDAAESNAGDDFHVLWTVRKCLELLNFSKEGLKAVSIEGLTSADEKRMVNLADSLLGVDLTEYYGGESFSEAYKIIVSQLKYSTRHADRPWTTALICKGKKHAFRGSIIHRLAKFFTEASLSHSREEIQSKLSIKLVSNRPAATDLQTAISEAKDFLKDKPNKVALASLLKCSSPKSLAILKKLAAASGLSSLEFTDFIRVFNLSDCNADSRFTQKQRLIKAMAETGSYKAEKEFESLYGLIRNKMMPEGREANTIKLADILYEFGFHDLSDLFPVKSHLANPENLIQREQVADIVKAINEIADVPIALHGGAGVGKSSIASMLPPHLPKGSVCLTYDCYGGGTYLNDDDKRHRHEYAFLQLSNELALETGTTFLLVRNHSDDNYVREFRKRLEAASKIIQRVNPGALLLIIIDAADNSITAANQNKEACFVQSLMRMSIPDGCRLIVSSRTERLSSIELPDGYKDLPISPFTLAETQMLLRKQYTRVTGGEVEEFWRLTNAIPRVMSYALAIPGETLREKLKLLKPGGKTLEDIFRKVIREAQRRSGEKKAVVDFLSYLILLPRPVPAMYLQKLCAFGNDLLMDISTDLWRGIVFSNGHFSFRDEDFESFLRNTYPADKERFAAIADLFSVQAATEEYASTHLGTALSHAGKKDELLEIVLEHKYLQHPQDPIKNKEVFVERTRLAMGLAAADGNDLNVIKLQLTAAQAAKTNKVLEDILLNSAELASAYGSLQMNQKLYFQSGNPEWFGAVHFRSAAVFSRNKETHGLAKEHLSKTKSWLAYRDGLAEEKREAFKLTEQDIAYGAEAVLRLSGVKACVNWLINWNPKVAVYKAVRLLLLKIIELDNKSQINKWLSNLPLRVDVRLLVVHMCFIHGLSAPFALDEILKRIGVVKRVVKKDSFSLQNEIMAFCEYGMIHGLGYAEVKEWIDLVAVKIPEHVPSFYDTHLGSLDGEKYNMDLLFRKACLVSIFEGTELKVEDFYPDSLKVKAESELDTEKERDKERKSKFQQLYKHFLPVYRVRAAILFKTANAQVLQKQLKEVFSAIEKDWELSYRHQHELKFMFKFLGVRLMDNAFYHRSNAIVEVIEKGFSIQRQNNVLLYLALAERLSTAKFYQAAVLKLLQKTEQTIDADTLPGTEQLEHYTKATIIASRISKDVGKYYFDKMVLSSSEIDLEAHDQIKSFEYITETEKAWNHPQLSFEFARYVEYCYERLRGWDHFPWQAGVQAIAKLNPATAFAVVCRWDHRQVRDLEEHFTDVVKEGMCQGFIDHITAASLLPINKYYWPDLNSLIKPILEGFDQHRDHKSKESFVRSFIRDLKLNFSPHHQFKTLQLFGDLIKDGKFLKEETIKDFLQYCEKIAALIGIEREKKESQNLNHLRQERKSGYEQFIKKVDAGSCDQITKAILLLKKKSSNDYLDASLFFNMLRQNVPASAYVRHLEALVQLDPETVSFWSYKEGLVAALKEWSFHPEVKAWKHKAFPGFLKDKFPHFITHDYLDGADLYEFASLFNVTDQELATLVLQLTPKHLEGLSASVLYQLLQITTKGLSKAEKQALLEWALPRWNEKIKSDFGDGEWSNKFQPDGTPTLTISNFLRYNLGHPDKRLRWRAAHSLRRFASLNQLHVFDHLIQKQDEVHCGQFQDGDYPFYWLSAKLFLWIAIERIAKENPAAMIRYKSHLFDELMNTSLPHAQIKHFIKSACLALHKFDASVFTSAELASVSAALTCKLIPKIEGSTRRRRSGRQSEVATRFRFDTLDTVPYWYSPLADALDKSVDEVIQIADAYITQHWGYTGNGRDNDPAASSKWELTSNRHGSESTIENLRTYFEYHAMFCAAGELVQGAKIIDDPDRFETWDSWLKGWGLCWEDHWLSDMRDPLPLLPKFWQNKNHDHDWEWEIKLSDFDTLLGIRDNPENNYITIKAGFSIHYDDKNYENNTVSSVLVSPQYATSLLKTLQTSEELRDYLPLEKDEDDEDDEQCQPFHMKGWIIDVDTRREGIDDRDELFQHIDRSRWRIGTEFEKWANLSFSNDYRFAYRNGDIQTLLTILEVWSNQKDEQHYQRFSTNGVRLRMQKQALLEFLTETNQCLILDCGIKRHMHRTERLDYYPEYTRIYLIHPNGQIETISGNHQLR